MYRIFVKYTFFQQQDWYVKIWIKNRKEKVKKSSSSNIYASEKFHLILSNWFLVFMHSILDRLTIESSLWNEITAHVSKIDIKLFSLSHVFFYEIRRILLWESFWINPII